jgi:hypothetical protein
LRPEHILFSRNGRVKVSGFALPPPSEIARLTEIELSPRAAQYLSPEQAQGKPPVPASDIYTLGVMLFEMVTGAVPFNAQDVRTLLLKHGQEQPAAPHRLNQDIPPQASQAILRALSKKPKTRQTRAMALIAVMRAAPVPPKQTTRQTQHTPKYVPVPPARRRPSLPARFARGLCWTLLRALPYLLAIAIAVLGGSYVYHAADRALNGSPKPAQPSKHTTHSTHKTGAHSRVALARGRRAAQTKATSGSTGPAQGQYGVPLLATPGCSGHNRGPVTLHYIRAEQVAVAAGGTVTLDYTLRNPASVCRDTFLGVTLMSTTQPGLQVTDRSGDVIVQAQPGVHVYQRRLTFPLNTAGQTFDAVFTTAGPLRAHTYSTVQLRHFFTVTK